MPNIPSAEADKIKQLNKFNWILPNGTPDNERMHGSGSHVEKNNIEQFFCNSKMPNPYLTSRSSSADKGTSHPRVKKNEIK